MPEGYVGSALALVGQCVDAVTQREQGAVDVGAFGLAHPNVVRLGGTLATRKVDHAQLAW